MGGTSNSSWPRVLMKICWNNAKILKQFQTKILKQFQNLQKTAGPQRWVLLSLKLLSYLLAPKLNVKKANIRLGEAAVTKRPVLIQWLKEGGSLILSFVVDWIGGVALLQAIIQGPGSFYSLVLPLSRCYWCFTHNSPALLDLQLPFSTDSTCTSSSESFSW